MAVNRRERKLLVVLGVMLVAGAVLFLVTSGGSSGDGQEASSESVVVSPLPSPSPSPDTAGTEGGKSKKKRGAKAAELTFSGRDPFRPLIDTTTSTSTSTSTGTTGSSTPSPTVSPAGSPEPGPGGGSSTTIDGHSVVLVDVFKQGGADMAQVEVDGTVYTVGVGDTFAESFQLEAIVGTCADFLYGDQSFTL